MTLNEFIAALVALRDATDPPNTGSALVAVRYPVGDTSFYLRPEDITVGPQHRGPLVVLIDVTDFP